MGPGGGPRGAPRGAPPGAPGAGNFPGGGPGARGAPGGLSPRCRPEASGVSYKHCPNRQRVTHATHATRNASVLPPKHSMTRRDVARTCHAFVWGE